MGGSRASRVRWSDRTQACRRREDHKMCDTAEFPMMRSVSASRKTLGPDQLESFIVFAEPFTSADAIVELRQDW